MKFFTHAKFRLERIPAISSDTLVLFVDCKKSTIQVKQWNYCWEKGTTQAKSFSKNLADIAGIKLIDNTSEY